MESDRAHQLLARERERIEQAIASIGDAGNEAADTEGEPGERGSEGLYQKELDEGLTEGLTEQLAAVERAEQRLASGTYGLSVESGVPIPDERLEALPTAERTLEEQRALGRG